MKTLSRLFIFISVLLFTSCAKDIVDLTGDIQGTVKDHNGGQLIENCRVALSPGGKSTSTDANGSFSFEDLTAGTYTLSFSKSGYSDATQEVSVVTGQTARVNVFMKLPSAITGTISGTIKDYDNGQLISNCNVSLSPGGVSKTSSSSGTYEFSELAPGSYSLTFSKAGYEDSNSTVTVTAGKTSTADVLLKAKSSFALSEDSYDFGDMEVSKTFYFFNNSDESTSFSISNIPSWLSFSQTTGTVKASGNEAVTATVDRSNVSEGDYNQNVTISYSGKASGSVNLFVKMKKVVLSAPTVSISGSAENIKQTSFDIKGNISATGGSQVTNYGHCWNTTGNPTINDSKTDLGTTDAICSFTSTAENLNTYTTYYVRAYAKNAQGISYSDQITVTTQDVASDKWDGTKASSFASGSGTAVDPYVIETGAQLVLVRDKDNAYYVLNNNIDLDNRDWQPFNFSGNLDGKGFVIQNLKVVKDSDNLGLISSLEGTVSNLSIVGVNINVPTRSNIGALAGSAGRKPNVSNCTVTLKDDSKLVGNSCVGGLIGYVKSNILTVQQCRIESSSSGDVIKGNDSAGGLIGSYHRNGSDTDVHILDNLVSANIFGGTSIGGIFGSFSGKGWKDIIKNCEFHGNLTGNLNIGGILGSTVDYDPTIEGCKASVNIIVSGDYAGGIVGRTAGYIIIIIASYSSGTITCSDPSATALGGICGWAGSYGEAHLSYSTITSSAAAFKGLSAGMIATDCATVTSDIETESRRKNCASYCNDITSFLYSCYSSYADKYNFKKTWVWKGKINGKDVEVSCPKLAWE